MFFIFKFQDNFKFFFFLILRFLNLKISHSHLPIKFFNFRFNFVLLVSKSEHLCIHKIAFLKILIFEFFSLIINFITYTLLLLKQHFQHFIIFLESLAVY